MHGSSASRLNVFRSSLENADPLFKLGQLSSARPVSGVVMVAEGMFRVAREQGGNIGSNLPFKSSLMSFDAPVPLSRGHDAREQIPSISRADAE
jgi:hypothetical protein